MKLIRGRFRPAVAGLVVLLLFATACGSDDDDSSTDTTAAPTETTAEQATGDPIVLSILGQAEGVLAQPELFSGAKAAAAAINAEGGIEDPAGGPNRPIEILTCEAGITVDPNAPLACSREAIDAGAVAGVSKYSSGPDVIPAFESAGIPLVGSLALTLADFSSPVSYLFGGASLALTSGAVVALQEAGAKTIAYVTNDLPSGRAVTAFVKPVLPNGFDKEVYLPVDPSADHAPFIADLIGDKPDGIFMINTSANVVRLIQEIRQAGYQGKIATVANVFNAESIKTLGDQAEGILLASDYPPMSSDNERMVEFRAEMDEYEADAVLSSYSLNAWVSVHLVADVLADLDTIDAASLKAALDGRQVDLGVSPPFTFGEAHNPLNMPRVPNMNVMLQEVKDGEVVASGDGEYLDLNERAPAS
jgi:ABC-type branched-subunit amino acid transport system substrate-binding protein